MDSFSCNTDFYYHVVSLMSLLPFRHFLVAIATGYSLLFGEPVILRCVGGYWDDLFSQVTSMHKDECYLAYLTARSAIDLLNSPSVSELWHNILV